MTTKPVPTSFVSSMPSYGVPYAPAPTDLRLDSNEGIGPELSLLAALDEFGPNLVRYYMKTTDLEGRIAQKLGFDAGQVIVTAGADDAITRLFRAYLSPGREVILVTPTFEMFTIFTKLVGATMVCVPWGEGDYPVDAILQAVTPKTAMIVVVSPNNPTGAVVSEAALKRLSDAVPQAVIALDLAYTAFTEQDLFPIGRTLENVVCLHTFSKSWGLAGLRVGYATASAEMIRYLRLAGTPYPVSSVSLALATKWLEQGEEPTAAYVTRIKYEREELTALLKRLGASPLPSEANFVFTRVADPVWLRDALAGMGISVRLFVDAGEFQGGVRITCPGKEIEFERLCDALRTILKPQALLFDMDGVLADVSRSYRRAIQQTAKAFGIELDEQQIAAAKAEPGSNNDWVTTQRLLQQHGIQVELDEVTRRFEELYQGTAERAGLREQESLLVQRDWLQRMAARLPLGIVTGRPRGDAERFLSKMEVNDLFTCVICLEDGPRKPDPAPVHLALQKLGIEQAWMIGDAPDDIAAARAAKVLPLGIVAPGDDRESTARLLTQTGAARVFEKASDIEEVLP